MSKKIIYILPLLVILLSACSSEERAMTQCSCDCGVAVNKAAWERYIDIGDKTCKNYNGPICSMLCLGTPKCINNVCEFFVEE